MIFFFQFDIFFLIVSWQTFWVLTPTGPHPPTESRTEPNRFFRNRRPNFPQNRFLSLALYSPIRCPMHILVLTWREELALKPKQSTFLWFDVLDVLSPTCATFKILIQTLTKSQILTTHLKPQLKSSDSTLPFPRTWTDSWFLIPVLGTWSTKKQQNLESNFLHIHWRKSGKIPWYFTENTSRSSELQIPFHNSKQGSSNRDRKKPRAHNGLREHDENVLSLQAVFCKWNWGRKQPCNIGCNIPDNTHGGGTERPNYKNQERVFLCNVCNFKL